jgi:hypothetical protein
MNIVDCSSLDLPAGTVLLADEFEAVLYRAWKSPRGLHIVTMHVPGAYLDNARFTEELQAAALGFRFIVALEILSSETAMPAH